MDIRTLLCFRFRHNGQWYRKVGLRPDNQWIYRRFGSVTLNFADEFDNYVNASSDRSRADGKIKTLNTGSEDYYLTNPEVTFDPTSKDYAQYDAIDEPSKIRARGSTHGLYIGLRIQGTNHQIQGGWSQA